METTYTYIPKLFEQIPDLPDDSIMSRTIYRDDRVKVILFAFAAGQELSEHTASQTAMLHFLQGEADLRLGNDARPAQPGTWVHMPPHLPHSIYAKTPVFMLLLLVTAESSSR